MTPNGGVSDMSHQKDAMGQIQETGNNLTVDLETPRCFPKGAVSLLRLLPEKIDRCKLWALLDLMLGSTVGLCLK